MKIGANLKNIFNNKLKDSFDVIEIESVDLNFNFRVKTLRDFKDFLKDKDLSMHSQTKRFFFKFGENNNLVLLEILVLKAEILACKELGIKELIMHLRSEKFNDGETKIFRDLLDFAKKNNVEILYESNINFSGEICLDFLRRFPDMRYVLDLGHLNLAIENNTLGLDFKEFISLIKERIVYIHAHNNIGRVDEHGSLNNGTLDWRSVLDMVDLSKVRKIIIEAGKEEDIIKTKKILEEYGASKYNNL